MGEKVKKLEKDLRIEKERSKKECAKTVQKSRVTHQEEAESKSQTLNRLLNEDEEYARLKNNEIEAKTEAADLRYRLEIMRKEIDKLSMKKSQLAEDNTRLYNLHLTDEDDKKKLKDELKILVKQCKIDKTKSAKENDRLKRDLDDLYNRVKDAEAQAKSSTDWKEKYQLLWQNTRPYSNVIIQPEVDYLARDYPITEVSPE